jgi:FkbM family methyltransferase
VEGWLASPRRGASPPAFRQYLVRQYAERYGREVLIESGTCYGNTVAAVLDLFSEIWTVELAPLLRAQAVARFASAPHVHCVLGDTTDVLPGLLTQASGRPALLWLDGHWSEGDTARGERETPIVAELEAVLSRPERYVVLVDDARCFSGRPHDCTRVHEDYPSLGWVRDRALSAGYTWELADDVVRLVHASERWPGYAEERERLLRAYAHRMTGIIHVGAGLGEEAAGYAAFGVPVTWVEGNPRLVGGLRWVTSEFGQRVVGAACSDRAGAAVFYETEDYRCSSLLPHAERRTVPFGVQTTTLDSLDLVGNVLVVDVQGAEALVLAGAEETLRHTDYVVVEVPDAACYPGADPDVGRFLSGFDLVAQPPGELVYARRA